MQPCLFCGGDASEPNHRARCDGRQGRAEADATAWPRFEPYTHARTSDPETSRAAADAIADATEVQRRVYAIHRQHPEGLTDEQLLTHYTAAHGVAGRSLESKSSPRKRRSDLTNAGVLIDSGARRPLVSGRNGVVWIVALRHKATG